MKICTRDTCSQKKNLQINFNLLQAKKWNTNDNAIQHAQSEIKTEKQTVVKKRQF